jgi:chromate transporter
MMNDKQISLFQIFWTFFKIGPVTFGGGYAMIPLLEREIVQNKKWIKNEDITDVFALAESIPGAIAINSSTFIGFRIGGIKGAIAALCGVFLPTFCIVILLSMLFLQVQEHPKIEAAFQAIRATIVALIVYAGYMIGKTAIIDKTTFTISSAAMFTLYFFHLHPVVIILTGIFLGIFLVKMKQRLGYSVTGKAKNEGDWLRGEGSLHDTN